MCGKRKKGVSLSQSSIRIQETIVPITRRSSKERRIEVGKEYTKEKESVQKGGEKNGMT